jgi:putative flippase GtrA
LDNKISRQSAVLYRRFRAGEAGRYAAATVASAGISFGLPVVFHEFLGLEERVAVASGLLGAFVFNFISVRTYVFKSDGLLVRQLLGFLIASAGFRAVEFLTVVVLMSFGLNYVAALVIALGSSFVAKFYVQKRFIFKPSPIDRQEGKDAQF